jgi:diacylglycerol kinase family enzyme
VVDATEHIMAMADDWSPRRVDLGVVNGRCFTFASGLGVDASVVERVDARPHLKARFGPWFFTWIAVSTVASHYLVDPPRLSVLAQGRTLEGVTAVVQNGSPFTYFRDRPIEIAEGSSLDSGSLSGVVLRRATPTAMPTLAWRALSRHARMVGHRQVTGLSDLTEMTVRAAGERPLPLQADGDYLGEVREARYSVMPRALNVVA